MDTLRGLLSGDVGSLQHQATVTDGSWGITYRQRALAPQKSKLANARRHIVRLIVDYVCGVDHLDLRAYDTARAGTTRAFFPAA